MLKNVYHGMVFYDNFYIIIIYLGPTFNYLIFLSSASTAPEPGHSCLIDPGHKPHKGKGNIIIINNNNIPLLSITKYASATQLLGVTK